MTDTSHSAEYPVYFSQSGTGFRLRLYDRGITLDQDGFAFTTEQAARISPIPVSGPSGCNPRLRRKAKPRPASARSSMAITTSCSFTAPIAGAAPTTRNSATTSPFCATFIGGFRRTHADRSPFVGGLGETRFMFLSATLSVGAGLFGVLPLVMLLLKPGFETLGLAVAGGGLCYAGWRLWTKNRPGPYSPDSIPDRLLP